MKARGPALESLYDGLHTPCPTRLTLYVSSGSGDPVDSAVEMSDVSRECFIRDGNLKSEILAVAT